MDSLNELRENKDIFFSFMKEKYPLYFNSNLFLRDLQYAIVNYFDRKGAPVNYKTAESLAFSFADYLGDKGDLVKINHKTWRVNFNPQ